LNSQILDYETENLCVNRFFKKCSKRQINYAIENYLRTKPVSSTFFNTYRLKLIQWEFAITRDLEDSEEKKSIGLAIVILRLVVSV